MAFYSATIFGVRPILVEIEIDLSGGLPFFQIVGLPDAILKESKTRVKSAILQGGYDFPYDQRVVLNLSPSKVKKEGTGFELGLAARILASSGQIPTPEFNVLFLGELALDGTIRSVPEIEALSFAAHLEFSRGVKIDLVVVATENTDSVQHLDLPVLGIKHIQELKGQVWWSSASRVRKLEKSEVSPEIKIDNIKFSEFWARHLLIAAVGRHHYFLCGPPGCGKTFFAETLQILLGRVIPRKNSERELLNAIFGRKMGAFPWAAPHHSASIAGLVGGGNPPRPGALTRAHGGLLFLDELLEFSASTLDSLREPLEKGAIEIYRAGNRMVFPSQFQLVAATNPCRCGHYGNLYSRCICLPSARQNYQAKLSGPFFDRFDVKLMCQPGENNDKRISGTQIENKLTKILNSRVKGYKPQWRDRSEGVFLEYVDKMKFSYRAQYKVRALSHTLAEIAGEPQIQRNHIKEACDLQVFKGLATVR